ncbi:MAG: hypothetical protein ACYC5O_12100 [Anaerolineae bacterium]
MSDNNGPVLVAKADSGTVVTCPSCGHMATHPGDPVALRKAMLAGAVAETPAIANTQPGDMVQANCGCFWMLAKSGEWQALGADLERYPKPVDVTLAKARLLSYQYWPDRNPVRMVKDRDEAEWAENLLGNLKRSAREDVSWADLLRDRDAIRLVKALGLDRPVPEAEAVLAESLSAEDAAWAQQTLALLDQHLTKGWDELLTPSDLERLEKAMKLMDLTVEEVSLVGKPANKRRFLLMKDGES